MGVIHAFDQFTRHITAASSIAELDTMLAEMTARMGYDFYALTHHVDWERSPSGALRLHNYPPQWAEYFERNGLGTVDPVHRASQRTAVGFAWRCVPHMIPLTRRDLQILEQAGKHGLGEGFTVPVHIPGEAHGSCSFATVRGRALPERSLVLAQLAGVFAFEAARRLSQAGAWLPESNGALTDRQRDCLVWAARGKGDWETSRILGISEETVAQHIRQACARYGVHKRTSLMIHALLDGTLSFAEIVGSWYPSFPG